MNAKQHGFTLAELAVVIMILGLVLGGLATVLPNQINNARINSTQQMLNTVNDALIGYAMTHTINGHPYLPCPAVSISGVEGPLNGGAACQRREGWLPWATLGTSQTDAWGNLIRYRVDAAFSDHSSGFLLGATANLQVCQHALTIQPCQAVALAVPAVYFSSGPDGYGSFTSSYTPNLPPPGANVDEAENTNGSNATVTADNPCFPGNAACTFVSHSPVDPGGAAAGGGQFGNIVGWLPANLLFSRLVAAGKLP